MRFKKISVTLYDKGRQRTEKKQRFKNISIKGKFIVKTIFMKGTKETV